MTDSMAIYAYGLVLIFIVGMLYCLISCIMDSYEYHRSPVIQTKLRSYILRTRDQIMWNTHAVNHLVVETQHTNLDQQAGSQLSDEIMKEEIYDSSTCKNDDCVICLEDFNKDEKIQVLVSRQHSFHGHCINQCGCWVIKVALYDDNPSDLEEKLYCFFFFWIFWFLKSML